MDRLLIICGPTGTGKTKLAVALAKKFNGELVSADSRQVYCGLDGLTGKDRADIKDIPVWLYDAVPIGGEFSVSQFQKQASQVIDSICERKKLPIVVGGTGLYLQSLVLPFDRIHVPPNAEIRAKFATASVEDLQKEVEKSDPKKWESMNNSDRNNPRRLIRAIEQADLVLTGATSIKRDVLWIGLTADKTVLEARIQRRVEDRWSQAVSEVDLLTTTPSRVSSTIIGFPIVQKYLEGSISQGEAIRTWVQKEFQYAKRQLTWFKKQSDIHWFTITDPSYGEQAESLVSSWYT